MNKQLLSIVAITLGLSIFGAHAQEAKVESPAKPQGTSAERKAERAKKRAEMAEANKKGEITRTGEASVEAQGKPQGTSAERKAARAKKRAEMARLNKEGKIPTSNEIGTAPKQ